MKKISRQQKICKITQLPLNKSVYLKLSFLFISSIIYVVGTQKNCPFEHSKQELKLVGKKII